MKFEIKMLTLEEKADLLATIVNIVTTKTATYMVSSIEAGLADNIKKAMAGIGKAKEFDKIWREEIIKIFVQHYTGIPSDFERVWTKCINFPDFPTPQIETFSAEHLALLKNNIMARAKNIFDGIDDSQEVQTALFQATLVEGINGYHKDHVTTKEEALRHLQTNGLKVENFGDIPVNMDFSSTHIDTALIEKFFMRVKEVAAQGTQKTPSDISLLYNAINNKIEEMLSFKSSITEVVEADKKLVPVKLDSAAMLKADDDVKVTGQSTDTQGGSDSSLE